MFHLGWFLNGTSVPRFGKPWSGNIGTQWQSAEIMVDVARAMERAAFDFVLVEDNAYIGDTYNDSMETYLKYAIQAPRQDPLIVATLLLQATRNLGVIPTIGTFGYHPYLVARMIGSLDQLSEGRCGANLVTGTSDRSAQNWGLVDGMEEHDLRYDKADDFVEILKQLWHSWEPGAVLADRVNEVFADASRVHRIDYHGEYYSSRGPLNSGPVSAGGPVIAQAGGSPRGKDFAANHADVIVAHGGSPEKMKAFREDVHRRMIAAGRDPREVTIMFLIAPSVTENEAEAEIRRQIKREEVENYLDIELARMSKSTDFDFGKIDLDTPVDEIDFATNGSQGMVGFFSEHSGMTLREAVIERGTAPGQNIFGTVDAIAKQMIDIADESGADGFLIASDGITRRFLAEITDGLVPRLQDLGATRPAYERGATLRENLAEF